MFANRDYEFSVMMHDCIYPFVKEDCVQTGERIGASIHLSIVDCPLTSYNNYVIGLVGSLLVTTPTNEPKTEFHVEDEVRLHLNGGVTPWIQDIVVCVPQKGNHMIDCVLNGNTTCPHRGCLEFQF